MAWPTHGGGRIGRHDLADYHPIEQVTQRGRRSKAVGADRARCNCSIPDCDFRRDARQ
jgi:hypothetical protein